MGDPEPPRGGGSRSAGRLRGITFHLPPLVPALELPVRPGAPLSKPGSQIVVGFKVGQELSHAGVPREQLSDDASAVGGCAEQVGQQFVAESAGGMSTA